MNEINEVEPQLTSMSQPSMPSPMSMLPEHGTPDAKPPFDKTKLLIPAAILLAGIIVSGSILFARLSAGQALVGGTQPTIIAKGGKVDVNISGAPVLGNANAPVTVVEFGDFQCPFCERYFQSNQSALVAEYVNTGKVKFVWKDYSFLGQESTWSAEAARCANDQGKFWPYHDYLYTHQGSENSGAFSVANLKKFAVVVGLDTAKFNSCLDGGGYASAVTQSTQYGSTLGVTGTPATFVNGTLIVGAVPYSDIKTAIDAALQNK